MMMMMIMIINDNDYGKDNNHNVSHDGDDINNYNYHHHHHQYCNHRFVGPVVKVSASRAEGHGSIPLALWAFFSRSPVTTLPGAWRYRVRVGTGCSGVSIL